MLTFRFSRSIQPVPRRAAIAIKVLIGLVMAIGIVATATASRSLFALFLSAEVAVELTHTVKSSDMRVTITEQGTIESSEKSEINCRVRVFSTVTWIIEGGSIVEPGGELVRLDTKRVEDAISTHTTESHTARATLERSIADLKQAELAEAAYLEGEYKTEKQRLQRELKIATTNLETAENMLKNSRSMFHRGYVTRLEVESNEFTVTQAKLELEVKQTQLDVLEKYTKEMRLETIRGNLAAAKSKKAADEAGLAMDEGRRDRANRELEMCVIKADRAGMIIYPSAAAWKDLPDVTEGAVVRRDQTLLLMPDLSKMQVKVGVHESMIDRVENGMKAIITVADLKLIGTVSSVAAVARPAGWWTGNVVKYDVIVDIPETEGLKPGMSSEVELLLADLKNVTMLPVASIIETDHGSFCWVQSETNTFVKRPIILGQSNEVFVAVKQGLEPGEVVALNPQKIIDEASRTMQLTAPNEQNDDPIEERSTDSNASDANDERKKSNTDPNSAMDLSSSEGERADLQNSPSEPEAISGAE